MTDPRTPRLTDLFKTALRAAASELRVALPGRVERYDPTTQAVDVLPLLQDQVAAEDGTESAVSLPVIPNVPVVFPGSGPFSITFPVAVGDTVLLVFADRSLDKWLASDGSSVVDPGVLNQHHLTDAIAIPGLRPFGKPLASAPPDGVSLGHQAGPQVKCTQTEITLGGGSAPVGRVGDAVNPTTAMGSWLTAVTGYLVTFLPALVVPPDFGTIAAGAPDVKA